jgi:peptidoglycan/xylan/chitin deacetylase (PgdA/CDA1 family)
MRLLLASLQADAPLRARTAALADALLDRGHQVIVVTDSLPLDTRATQVDGNVGGTRVWRAAGALATLVRAMRRYRVEAAVACGHGADGLTRRAAQLTRTPLAPALKASAVSATELDVIERACRSAYVRETRLEIPILCYHRLVERDDAYGPANIHLAVEKFEAQLQYLQAHGYRTMHFRDLSATEVFTPSHKRVILTFDDGYEDNYRLLLPLLRKYDAKAVVYLVSDRERNVWDAERGEPSLRLLSAAERREMLDSGLIEFGAHTATHADLSTVPPDAAAEEIRASKDALEATLGVPIETLAYPYGRLSPAAKAAAADAGFRYALATNSGPLAIHDDPYHVRRIVVLPSITPARFARKVSGRYVQRPAKDPALVPDLTLRYDERVALPTV